MSGPARQIVEFYRSGQTVPFCRRGGLTMIPSKGDSVDVSGVTGEVVGVTWNLDYCGKPHETWRCNVYIREEAHK